MLSQKFWFYTVFFSVSDEMFGFTLTFCLLSQKFWFYTVFFEFLMTCFVLHWLCLILSQKFWCYIVFFRPRDRSRCASRAAAGPWAPWRSSCVVCRLISRRAWRAPSKSTRACDAFSEASRAMISGWGVPQWHSQSAESWDAVLAERVRDKKKKYVCMYEQKVVCSLHCFWVSHEMFGFTWFV